MGILTMKIFINALESSAKITDVVGDRIFPIAVPGTDDEFDNTPLPYIVVGYSGPNNQAETKDDVWGGEYDLEQVHVLYVAETIDGLAELEENGRKAIVSYFESLDPDDENFNLLPDNGVAPQGDMVEYAPWKPCYSHTLSYQCETKILL